MVAEAEITNNVRLTDTYSAFDTLMLDPKFTKSPAKLFEIMDTVAGTKIFKTSMDNKYDF